MNKENSFSLSNTLSVNPYKKSYVNVLSNFLNTVESPVYDKEQYVISYLNTKSFINTHIYISKNIPQEDLYDAIYNKTYDELDLDQAVMYEIRYIENLNIIDDENRSFHVFIIDPAVIDDIFKDVVEKIKYIDYIIPSPLLLKTLYSKQILQSDGVDCFIYFQENDTFITIYNEKNFVFTKSINYSFVQMHERFCEIYGEMIQYNDFIDFLSNEDLKKTQSKYKLDIIKLYKEIFASINDVLTYVKRAVDIDKIENVYIDTQLPSMTKLDEIAEVELGIKSHGFIFDYGFETNKNQIDHLHSLMHLFYTSLPDERYECNFSPYNRPAKFINRDSGRAILLGAASLLLAFIYPLSYWTLAYTQSLKYDFYEDAYISLHKEKTQREADIINAQNDKKELQKLLSSEKRNYTDKKNTLIKIHNVKVDYPMKASLLDKLTSDLNKYDVKIESAFYNETPKSKNADASKELKLNLVSSDDKKMTDLIKHLTKIYDKKFHFFIEKISYEESEKLFFGELKVELL